MVCRKCGVPMSLLGEMTTHLEYRHDVNYCGNCGTLCLEPDNNSDSIWYTPLWLDLREMKKDD